MKPSLLLLAATVPNIAYGLNITLDFTHDDFFTNPDNPYGSAGQAAIEAAAAEISGILGGSYNAITTNSVSGTSNGTTASITVNYNYVDPQDSNNTIQRSSSGIAEDEIIIYVGSQTMGNFTFAESSTGVAGISLGGSSSTGGAGWADAAAIAEANSNALYGRGSQPVLSNITTSAAFGSNSANFNLDFGPAVGSMWFNDSLADNTPGQEATRDSWEVNNEFWHFDHTTEVGTGKIDIYSVALHEIIHVLGYGTSDNWFQYVSGTEWTGPAATAILGEGVTALEDDQVHILDGLESEGYLDGELRLTVMNSYPTLGERDQLTELDLAFISDLGYTIVPAGIPEPSSGLLAGLGGLFAFLRRKHRA